MARRDKASIYVDLQKLYEIIYMAQFDAPKRDRIALINKMLEHCERCISYFVMTYESEDKKRYIELLISEFECLKIECRFATDTLCIIRREGVKNEIREKIVTIENGIDKWRSHLFSLRQE